MQNLFLIYHLYSAFDCQWCCRHYFLEVPLKFHSILNAQDFCCSHIKQTFNKQNASYKRVPVIVFTSINLRILNPTFIFIYGVIFFKIFIVCKYYSFRTLFFLFFNLYSVRGFTVDWQDNNNTNKIKRWIKRQQNSDAFHSENLE